MAELASTFEAAGCRDVRTHLQSGNVVFRASRTAAARVASAVSGAIAGRHGLRVPVVLRTGAELRAAAEGNPFLRAGAPPETLHVVFLADRPSAAAAAALDPARSPPDAFEVRGREVYLRCPGGLARTRLTTGWFDARLGTTSTVRSWRTVLALAAMAAGG
jgi:uncharacterized protein (DUF1697 family)